jgi:predicted RNA-binding protein
MWGFSTWQEMEGVVFFRVKHPAMHFRLRGNDVEISGQVVEIDWDSSLVCTTSDIFFSFLFFLGSLLLYL